MLAVRLPPSEVLAPQPQTSTVGSHFAPGGVLTPSQLILSELDKIEHSATPAPMVAPRLPASPMVAVVEPAMPSGASDVSEQAGVTAELDVTRRTPIRMAMRNSIRDKQSNKRPQTLHALHQGVEIERVLIPGASEDVTVEREQAVAPRKVHFAEEQSEIKDPSRNLRTKRPKQFLTPAEKAQREQEMPRPKVREVVSYSVPDEVLEAIDLISAWVCNTEVPERGGTITSMQMSNIVSESRGLQDVDDLLSEVAFEARRRANALSNRILDKYENNMNNMLRDAAKYPFPHNPPHVERQ